MYPPILPRHGPDQSLCGINSVERRICSIWEQSRIRCPKGIAVMNVHELCGAVGKTLPPLFVCSPAPQEGVRVRTPLLYPDGGLVDVFVLERSNGYIITDHGDALGWLGLQSVSRRLSPKQNLLVKDVCQTLGLQLFHNQLVLRSVPNNSLGESVLRVAQAAVRVSDLWFTLRSHSLQTTADEVDEWLSEKRIPFERQVTKQGRSAQSWTIDFETQTDDRTSLIFLLNTGVSRSCQTDCRARLGRLC